MENSEVIVEPVDLSIGSTLKNSLSLGLKNFFPLAINTLLWVLTIWIPYINIGTTIGLFVLVIAMKKGERIKFTEIFNPIYRKYMGEFFLATSLITSGVLTGLILGIIPGFIISFAWSQAIYLMFDKEYEPLKAIHTSNKITYGYKLKMIASSAIVNFIMMLVVGLIALLFSDISSNVESEFLNLLFVMFLLFAFLFMVPFNYGITAYFYKELSKQLK